MQVNEYLFTEPQLSIHAITGVYNYKTMRIISSKGTKPLFLLIDLGSTHNFLDNKLAKKLGCLLEPITALKGTTTNGNELLCNEVCKNF